MKVNIVLNRTQYRTLEATLSKIRKTIEDRATKGDLTLVFDLDESGNVVSMLPLITEQISEATTLMEGTKSAMA